MNPTSVIQAQASQGTQFSLLPCGRLMKPVFHCLSVLPTTKQHCGQWLAGQSQPAPAPASFGCLRPSGHPLLVYPTYCVEKTFFSVLCSCLIVNCINFLEPCQVLADRLMLSL